VTSLRRISFSRIALQVPRVVVVMDVVKVKEKEKAALFYEFGASSLKAPLWKITHPLTGLGDCFGGRSGFRHATRRCRYV
jgi:hypothetical protein